MLEVTQKHFIMEMKPHRRIGTDTCQPVMTPDGEVWRYPCGLALSAQALADGPGCELGAMHWVHERHHRECAIEVDQEWSIACMLEMHDNWVKMTFDCKRDGKH